MDSISIEELLELSIFKCKYCKKRCQYPVMTVDNIGNFCAVCIKHAKGKTVVANTEINTVLEKFIIPCTYYEKGCDTTDKIVELTLHEKRCEFKDNVCPLYEVNKCNNSLILNVADHFKSKHTEYVIQPVDNNVKLNFNIANLSDLNILKLLVLHNENFLLHVKFDVNNKELLYVLYFCGDPEFMKYYECSIQQGNNNIHTANMDFCLLHESDFTININKPKAICYDLKTLQRCFDEIETVINITQKNAFTNVKNSDILKTLKCPTCQSYMRGEIHQCVSGHSMCNECITELKKCSVCNATFSGTRNYTLETLSALLKYPCVHKGCNKYFSAKNISRHESDCSFKQYGCPFRETFHCQWNGVYADLTPHMIDQHHENFLQKNYCERKILLDNIQTEVYCLSAFKSIFRFHLEKEPTVYSFTCKYIGKKSLAKRYTFEIGLINQQKRDNKLIIKNSWGNTSEDELWIEIHDHDVEQYTSTPNEMLLFYKISVS